MLYLAFAVGLMIGSFCNVLLSRLDREEGIIWGRSRCPHCRRTLQWYELIPLVSFLLLKARCRTCRERIAWRYPLVELSFGIFSVIYVSQFGLNPNYQWLIQFFIALGFLLLVFFDLYFLILPDKIIFPMILLALVWVQFFNGGNIFQALEVGLLLAGIFGILYLVSQGAWIGLGDIKLIFHIGVFFAYPQAVFILLTSIWLASIVGISLILIGRANLKTALPFGSFLSSIALIFLIFHDQLSTFFRIFS